MSGNKNQIHIVKNPSGGWCNKNPNATSCHETQKSAISHAVNLAKASGDTEVVIHGKSGKIRSSSTYHRKDDSKLVRG
ncbi:MAG: DUF2188 domain-containing protein [Methanobacteriaceae archaeon]